ncbi:DUF4352 domain-containing protein [Actinoplanes sp. NPDC023714]|uniref:DUF4352 domain-containing protein n=1 Tax=Actinoplanes sp. NPDC023714 TaxID=3154322 RepID=UPI0033FA6F64
MTHSEGVRSPRTQQGFDPGAPPLKPALAIVVACAVVIALFAVGMVAGQRGREQKEVVAAAPAVTRSTGKPAAGIGDPVRDGKFEFVVSGVDCSRSKVGIEQLARTADGKFCVVSLSVRNIAGEPKYLIGAAQKAIDSSGASYGNDEITSVYLNRGMRTFFAKLDPGERVSGVLVFDVPERARLTSLELHDFLLSGGVTVSLR